MRQPALIATLLVLPILALLTSCSSTPSGDAPGKGDGSGACGGTGGGCGGEGAKGCCGGCGQPLPGPSSDGTSDLDRFRRDHPYTDPDLWFSLEVSLSTVTETRRRIFVEKEAVTRALLAHPGGAAPMRYPPGTVFVAEALDPSGNRLDTEVLRVRPPGPPFLLFDHEGRRSSTFVRPADPDGGFVPRVCMICHRGRETFEPMRSFPGDAGERTVLVDPRWRDGEIVERFDEGRLRGNLLFGPYAALWLARLRADARDGTLTAADRPHWERLRVRYPGILSPPGE